MLRPKDDLDLRSDGASDEVTIHSFTEQSSAPAVLPSIASDSEQCTGAQST